MSCRLVVVLVVVVAVIPRCLELVMIDGNSAKITYYMKITVHLESNRKEVVVVFAHQCCCCCCSSSRLSCVVWLGIRCVHGRDVSSELANERYGKTIR